MLFPEDDTLENRIKVVNKYKVKSKYVDIMIGSGSPLGNPYAMSPNMSQQKKVDNFADYLHRQLKDRESAARREMESLLDRLLAGEKLRLGCCCKPKPCHGDVIRTRLLKAARRRAARLAQG